LHPPGKLVRIGILKSGEAYQRNELSYAPSSLVQMDAPSDKRKLYVFV
jgi:hypothetical protein